MKRIIVFLFLFSGYNFIHAQTNKSDLLFVPGGVNQYQFHLEKPAKSIEGLQYEKTGEPIKGNLSPDGSRVIMDNYKKGSRVKFKANYGDGTSEEVIKSPCYIDPFRYEL